LSCNKYIVFNKKYSKLLNELIPELNGARKKLVVEITKRNIPTFRNDIVGHIHSQKLKRPLTVPEYQELFNAATGGMSNLNKFRLYFIKV